MSLIIADVWVFHAPRLFRILTLGSKVFTVMAVWPVIISSRPRQELDSSLINHERIHFRQQAELLWLPFFAWYFLEFLIRFISCGNRYEAYRRISFEREAYWYQEDPDYLKTRHFWAHLRFLGPKAPEP